MPRPRLDIERSAQILEAFERCVMRQGLANTSLTDVANEAGLPRPLVRHFVGNRDDMVTKLFDGMIDRAESQLEAVAEADELPLAARLDLLFAGVFANETSNALIGELWYLAERDEAIRARLAALYRRACDFVAEGLRMIVPKISAQRAYDISFALVSMSYGDASFRGIGMQPPSPEFLRTLADSMIKASLVLGD
ncbi:MAG: TetR/AcrR family transcriptional regulator [Pseudomonadota bacterium]